MQKNMKIESTEPLFPIGEPVVLKSDIQKKCPMIIAKIFKEFDDDTNEIEIFYQCRWTTAAKIIETDCFNEKCLMPIINK